MESLPQSLRERRVFIDSSAYLVLLDQDDAHHSQAAAILRQIAVQRYRQFSTNAILIESHALILSAMGTRAATHFLRSMENSNTVVVRVRSSDEERAKQVISRYHDKDFSFTDALSFIVMERLGLKLAFTFDRHFAQYA
jgi:predicted nucleic acid-binding protein